MSDGTFKLDMTMMFAVHDALRRDLQRIARISATTEDDPQHVLRAALGWEMFKSFLRVHHTSEDVSIWAVMEKSLADRPEGLAVLQAMEGEHAAIDPMLEAVDAALADSDGGPQRLGDAVDNLVSELTAHLKHEEVEALPLIDATMTPEQWKAFSEDHRNRIGSDASRYLPWLLDEAKPETVAGILGRMPEPLLLAYENEWRKTYAELRPWTVQEEPPAS